MQNMHVIIFYIIQNQRIGIPMDMMLKINMIHHGEVNLVILDYEKEQEKRRMILIHGMIEVE